MTEPRAQQSGVPACPADGTRMVDTIVGWRCPFCGAGTVGLPRAA